MKGVHVCEEQIVERINKIKESDPMGHEVRALVERLPYATAKQFLSSTITSESFTQAARTLRPPMEVIYHYLELAWSRANDCRGMSAAKSIQQMRAWLYLGGFEDVVDAHFTEYEAFFGKKQLIIASLLTQFRWQDHDDGQWRDATTQESLPPTKRSVHLQAAYDAVEAALKARDL